MDLGHVVFGWGVMMMAAVGLVLGKFLPGQPVPKAFPAYTLLAYAAAAFMLVAGAATAWRRTAAWGAAALAVYYAVVVVVLMHGRILVAHFLDYGPYEDLAEQVAIAAAGLIVYAAFADIDAALAARLERVGRILFGLCAVIWGGAHFAFMNLTAPLVPKWLPPNQVFWGYATGVFHIAGGLAILSGIQARLAAILLAAMYASFALLAWLPVLAANPSSIGTWSEMATTIALIGCAWVVADSLSEPSAASAVTRVATA
jgi:uncharacterized membrane protein